MLVDVGSTFQTDSYKFDHHQKGFEEKFDTNKYPQVKMSSAGLIYKYFGIEVIKNIAKSAWNYPIDDISEDDWTQIHQQMYKGFILEIDAIDNGVELSLIHI